MKTTIILSEEGRQINFKPENEQEKLVLQMFTPNSNIKVLVKEGGFGERGFKPFSIDVQKCKGGHLRCFDDENSIMLCVTESPVKEEIDYETIKTSVISRMVSFAGSMLDENYHTGYEEGIRDFILALNKQ